MIPLPPSFENYMIGTKAEAEGVAMAAKKMESVEEEIFSKFQKGIRRSEMKTVTNHEEFSKAVMDVLMDKSSKNITDSLPKSKSGKSNKDMKQKNRNARNRGEEGRGSREKR